MCLVYGAAGAVASSGRSELLWISVMPEYSTHVTDEYLESVDARDEAGHCLVASVSPEGVERLGDLSSVRTLRPALGPVIRAAASGGSVIPEAGSGGRGIRIGVISDGIDSQSSLDVEILDPGSGHEGTQMVRVIRSVAPDAEILFHGAGTNTIEFCEVIDELLDSGCDIICDDVGWPGEPFFEDGSVARHVRSVTEREDVLYLSAAGNDADGHYQGFFSDDGSGRHDFATEDPEGLVISVLPGREVSVVLQWDEPFGRALSDYDLFLSDSGGCAVASSSVRQDGDDDPIEVVVWTNTGSEEARLSLEVSRHSGDPALLEILVSPGRFLIENGCIHHEDSVYGHPAVPGVVAVGAVGDSGIEAYSSQGPVTIRYPLPESRQKPDICAYDRPDFRGTSASVSEVAGLAAVLWSEHPEEGSEAIRARMYDSASDMGMPGPDNVYGSGLLRPAETGPAQERLIFSNFLFTLWGGWHE